MDLVGDRREKNVFYHVQLDFQQAKSNNFKNLPYTIRIKDHSSFKLYFTERKSINYYNFSHSLRKGEKTQCIFHLNTQTILPYRCLSPLINIIYCNIADKNVIEGRSQI